ncbi:DUF4097 family beta strand repeat protein [Paenibacillus campinasensis]|uniref:DUF4097 family beta strand repeat protein n=1 Tax=Paenibacillus campinasensis TaxID=66347 RepID=A0ABW9T175_9BACL|nr:DUF4097 family beta strand repeat-containing protein [Paenibacillus campinasensis]MUG66652.1 DUF4097 family beta strand repeat protein [Paenibacillus campinasensis]
MNKKMKILAVLLIAVGFAGMAVNKFKFGPEYMNYTREWELKEDQLVSLDIKSGINMNISVRAGESSSGYIRFEGLIPPELVEALEGLALSGSVLEMDIMSPMRPQIMAADIRTPKGTIDVVLPDQSRLEEFTISSHANNIKLNNAASKRIDISVGSGNITLANITADQLHMDLSSGNIVASDIEAPIELLSRSGNVKLDQVSGPVNIESYSGSINLVMRDNFPVNIQGRSGNISVQPASTFRGFYDLKTDSGNVKAPDSPKETTDTITVETYSGNITIVQ